MTDTEADAADALEIQTQGHRAIRQLNSVLRMLRVHDGSNPAVDPALDRLAATLNSLRERMKGSVRFEFASGVAFVNEVRLRTTPTNASQVEVLRADFSQKRLGGVAFHRAMSIASLRAYFSLFVEKEESEEDLDRNHRTLIALGRDLGIEILEPKMLVSSDLSEESSSTKESKSLEIYARLIAAFELYLEALEDEDSPGERVRVARIVRSLVELSFEKPFDVLALAALRSTNQAEFDRIVPRYASGHAANMCVYAMLIGRVLGLGHHALLDLGTTALLGDVSLALLPETLTERDRVLDASERRALLMAMTRASGALIGQGHVSDAMKRHLVVNYEHHKPYRNAKSGRPDDLHVLSRIVSVACAFDAMTAPRPWRPAMSPKSALSALQLEAGSRFDPAIVGALVSLIETFASRAYWQVPSALSSHKSRFTPIT